MNDFKIIMEKIKKKLNISSDTELSDKLGIKRTNYSEKKRNNSIPYENITILCKKENISIDFILNNVINSEKLNNPKELLINSIEKLNEKECKYYYHLIELEKSKKEIEL